MTKTLFRVVSLVLMVALLSVALGVSAQAPVEIVWFVGLGTGTNADQIAAQEAVVAAFNASQSDIRLVLNVAASNDVARDTLQTLIASGNAPDIVGPVGFVGANAFDGQWLDIAPYVASSGYDLTQFPQSVVDFYRDGDGLIGLPLATFPSFIYFNRELFDEAGLEYPPQAYGEPYVNADGEEVTWDWDALADLAELLTVDAAGNDATSPDFDPNNIVQFGFVNQWNDLRNELSIFGAGIPVGDDGNAMMPENWREAARWVYDAIWERHFYPNASYEASELLQGGGGAFSSGNVAMARTHLWYTCCLGGVTFWDIAVNPEYNGTITSTLHADTFRVWGGTAHPEEAFEVLAYLTGESALPLLNVYGGMPAREEERADFFAGLDERYPQGVTWSVAEESLAYPDIPSHEANLPNFNKVSDRLGAFQTLIKTEPNLDIDAEIDRLTSDLQAFYDEVR